MRERSVQLEGVRESESAVPLLQYLGSLGGCQVAWMYRYKRTNSPISSLLFNSNSHINANCGG